MIYNFHIGEKGKKKDFWKTEWQNKIEGVNSYPKFPQLHKTSIHKDLAAPAHNTGASRHLLSKQAGPPPQPEHEGKQINLTAHEATEQVKKSYIIFIIKYS